jgi:hypothetical protein
MAACLKWPVGQDTTGEEGLIARSVKDRSRIVAHTSIDGDVRADVRQVLDGADGVEGDGGSSGDRPSGLDPDRRGDSSGSGSGLDDLRPLTNRWGLFTLDVGNPESSADDKFWKSERFGELAHDRDRLCKRLGPKHLRANVSVNANQLDRG